MATISVPRDVTRWKGLTTGSMVIGLRQPLPVYVALVKIAYLHKKYTNQAFITKLSLAHSCLQDPKLFRLSL